MKTASLIASFLLLNFSLAAQSLEEKIAQTSCQCLEAKSAQQQISNEDLKTCVSEAMAKAFKEANSEERKVLSNLEGVQQTFEAVQEVLSEHCGNGQKTALEEKRNNFYRPSTSEKANELFEEGNIYLETGNYFEAVKLYKKAIKKDHKFVYALDHLGMAYRRMGDLEKAGDYYKKSLKIFPEGDFALLNIAVIYSLEGKHAESLKYYEALKSFYPENPEGYFGIARVSFVLEDYEHALDHIFTAHKLYAAEDSPLAEDSRNLMGMMYFKLAELDRSELFLAIAEANGVEISVD